MRQPDAADRRLGVVAMENSCSAGQIKDCMLADDPYVFGLRDAFLGEGISCTCEQQEDFVEAFVDFR